MKNIVFIVTFILFTFSLTKWDCVNQETSSNNKYFKLLNATSSSWTAGTASGGSGIEYYFKITINTKHKIDFDSIWVGNHSNKIVVSKEQKLVSNEPIEYYKGDTITLRLSVLNKNIINKKHKNGRGAALISYRINDKLKYYTINKIETLKPIYYP